MTIDNSDETARVSAGDAVDPPVAELSSVRATALQEDVDLSALDAPPVLDVLEASTKHDSVAPMSRKLAPPPKPRRDSGSTSGPPTGPPSVRPPSDAGIDSALASSALKAPIAPTISYSAEHAGKDDASADGASTDGASTDADRTSDIPVLPPVPGSTPPLSSPPPIPRRRSNPGLAVQGTDDAAAPQTARSPSRLRSKTSVSRRTAKPR